MTSLRIENAYVLTMVDGVEAIERGAVEVRGNVISYVGPADGPGPPGVAAPGRAIDGTGCVLLPGLVNAHTHLAMTLFRGYADDMPLQPWLEEKIWPIEGRLRPEDVYWGTMLGALELLRGGVTCFSDMYHQQEMCARAAIDSGMRACPSQVLLGVLPGADALLEDAAHFIGHMNAAAHPRIHPMLGPHAPYTCPDNLLRKVVARACELDVPIHIHLSETAQEVTDSLAAHGERPIAHMEAIGLFEAHVLAAHCVHLDDQDIAILAGRKVGVAHCPGSNMKLASGFQPLPELLGAGAHVGLGTDGAASNNNLNLFEEMLLAAIIHKGHSGDPTAVPAAQALRMATLGGARALGLEGLIGTLEVGKRADMVLVSLARPHTQPVHSVVSHLVYAAQAADVRTTVVDGVPVFHEGQFEGLDEERIIARATECARRLARQD